MHFNHLLTAAAAAAATNFPAARGEFNPDADPVAVVGAGTGAGHGATTLSAALSVTQPVDGTGRAPAPSDAEGGVSPAGDEFSSTTTGGTLPAQPVPAFDEGVLFVGPTWSATKYYDANEGGLVDVAEGSVITLEVEGDGRFDGHAGCNSYFGRLELSSVPQIQQLRSAGTLESSLVIDGPVGSTMRMCIQEATMVQEAAYLANFEGTIHFSVSQDSSLLRLKGEEGNVVAEYTLFIPRILDHTWIATKYYSSQEDGLVDVIPGSVVSLKMEVDEKLSGSAGCNTYFGAYDDLNLASFAISGPIESTRMYCGQQDDLMDQERSYLKIFEGGHMKWRTLDGGSLELRDSDSGAVVALYNTALEKAFDPLSASIDPLSGSGGMTLKATSAAVAMAAAMVFMF